MNDGFSWWLVLLGIAVGIGLVWLVTVRLPRSESDVSDDEIAEEAGWISQTVESAGGIAPRDLVHEVLDLHRQYLAGERTMTSVPPPERTWAPDASAAGPSNPEVPPSPTMGSTSDLPASPVVPVIPDAPPSPTMGSNPDVPASPVVPNDPPPPPDA
jgi:hypothetical protein